MTQIKLGFDRVPIPSVKGFDPLYDILKGVPLRDANGNIIVSEVEGPLGSLANARSATSVYVNNDYLYSVPIQEQFQETSEVSTTLLGIPRAETQLSLFSDVSTYGLNPEEFEFYSFNGLLGRPSGWYARNNETYGNHYYPRLKEETNEQALVIEAFPVPYTFAPGPRWEGLGYNEASYDRFVKFIELGNQLYEDYKTSYLSFAEEHFLNPASVTVSDGEVVYNVDEQDGYDLIEKWTLSWMDMRDRRLEDPANPGSPLDFLEGYGTDDTRPGAGSSSGYYGILQSKKAYRYQPGRISGFTYGFKCSTDDDSVDNIIEWGVGNPTDQYVFQVRGAAFNIVRRSTVALPDIILERQGLRPEDQQLVGSGEPIDDTLYYETVISRDFFNGDSLDGTGPSGYQLNPQRVTMYKIEFGWYGAIGAKFYAYVPTDTGDARWVLMHTLVIENGIGEPCLEDPYFKFRYSLNLRDTSSLRKPQFLYKYGASCYIDGGDNTAGNIYSYSSDENAINNATDTPVLGLYPKQFIANTEGYKKPNRKNVYPSTLKVSADQLTQIQTVEVSGCPAFGHHYAPSLHAKQNGTVREIDSISADGKTIIFTTNDLTIDDNDAKLVANGIWSSYVQYNSENTVTIERIGFDGNYTKANNQGLPVEINLGGTITEVANLDLTSVRFSNYDAIATTSYPLTGDTIDVNFLNPVAIESTGQWCEFLIGITEKKPELVEEQDGEGNPVTLLKFLRKDGQTLDDPSLNDLLYEEFTHSGILRDRDGYEQGEGDYPIGIKMDMDYRLSRPEGDDSGTCSSVRIQILERINFDVTYTTTNPSTSQPGHYLVFSNRPSQLINADYNLLGGEFGIGDTAPSAEPSGLRFASEVTQYTVDQLLGTLGYYIEITDAAPSTDVKLWLSPVSISDRNQLSYGENKNFTRTKIFSFELKPLYLVIRMRDNAKINNVTITESINDASNSFCPDWITNSGVDVVFSGGSQTGAPAANYTSKNRLESASVDTSVKQPLRPGQVKDTIYVAPNTKSEISLEGVYGPDRTTITPGLLNTTATFLTARSLENNDLNIVNVNVNTKEN